MPGFQTMPSTFTRSDNYPVSNCDEVKWKTARYERAREDAGTYRHNADEYDLKLVSRRTIHSDQIGSAVNQSTPR